MKILATVTILVLILVGSAQAEVTSSPVNPKPVETAPTEPKEKPKQGKKVSAAEKKEAERKLEKFIDRMNAIEDKQVFGR